VTAFFLLQSSSQSGSPVTAIVIQGVLIAAIFYFLIFGPAQKQKKRTAQMLAELKSGDQVVTSGGITGTVTAVDGDTLTLRVKPDNLKLQFVRSAITQVVTPEATK
jgi:preprotein translocase subunit YajC